MPEIKEFKNIAIIQTAFLGDVALALPLAQAIRNFTSDSYITFITTPVAAPLVSASRAVNEVITFDKRNIQKGWNGIKGIASILKKKDTQCIIAPHRSLRTTLITRLTKPEFSVGFDRNAMSFCYSAKLKYDCSLHEIDRNLSLLKAFSDYGSILKDYDYSVNIDIPDSDKDYVLELLNANQITKGNFVVIAPGSVWNTKRWKKESFVESIKMLSLEGYSCVLTGSQSDRPLCEYIAENSGAVNLSGMTTLPRSLYLLSVASLIITNDSAPTHLAGLAGCPAITIFGPTVPGFGFAPRGKLGKVIEVHGLKCRPCRIHGSNKCPINTHECMTGISPAEVVAEALSILSISK